MKRDDAFLRQYEGLTDEQAVEQIQRDYGFSSQDAWHWLLTAKGQATASDVGDISWALAAE